jgi:hypothetical protein
MALDFVLLLALSLQILASAATDGRRHVAPVSDSASLVLVSAGERCGLAREDADERGRHGGGICVACWSCGGAPNVAQRDTDEAGRPFERSASVAASSVHGAGGPLRASGWASSWSSRSPPAVS